jgi:LPXTG-site transpeptidase (sortase) family protein
MQRASALTHFVTKPWEALGVFIATFFLLAVFLNLIDFIPEKPAAAKTNAGAVATPTVSLSQVSAVKAKNLNLIAGPAPAVISGDRGIEPTRVVIGAVGIDTPVSNPVSTNVEKLDTDLLSGAVHYPGTASLDEEGSVLLFGHQSYLPIIHNQAFKAFNNVQKLKEGDTISVYSGSTEYRYAVRTVTLVTTDIGSIALETTGRTLTLVTCNSLGAKEERYIVRADFIGTYTN